MATAACFGAGYTCCWAQSREESVPQITAYMRAASWAGLTQGLRLASQSLPEDAPRWPREMLAKVEALELSTLLRIVTDCAAGGHDSALLRSVALRRLCQHAKMAPNGPALAALTPEVQEVQQETEMPRRNLQTLVEHIDETAVALADATRSHTTNDLDVLLPLVSAIQAIVATEDKSFHEVLEPDGMLRLLRVSVLASAWLASACQQSPAVSSEEDRELAADGLQVIWQELGQPSAAEQARAALHDQRGSAAVQHDVAARLAALQEQPCQLQALQESLPACVQHQMLAVTARNAKAAQAQAKAAHVRPCASEATEHAPGKGSTQRVGVFSRLSRMLEYSAWAIIISCAFVALSDDGFGYFRFRLLPGPLRDSLRSLMQQQAVQVEELMAKYDPPPENGSMSDSIMLGPWGASSSYIQVPQGPTVSMEY